VGDEGQRDSATVFGDVTAERFAAAAAEEELRRRLEHEEARSAALQRDLETVRSSEAFRVGHVLVEGIQARLPRTLRGLPRALWGRLGGRSLAASGTDADAEGHARATNAVLFIAWGADARLGEHAERVERLRARLVDVEPIFLVDSMDLDQLRGSGHAIEYVVPLAEWREHRPAVEWGTYVLERIAAVRARYRPRAVVVLEGALDGPAAVSALDQGVLDSILLPKLGTSDDNRLDR
jgi:hypothetical protein